MSEQAIDTTPTDLRCTVCDVELTAGEVEGIVSADRAVRRRTERVAVVLSGCAVSIGGPAGVLAPTRGVRLAGWRVV